MTDSKREWLTSQGYDVPPRGRLRKELMDAWDAAHPDDDGPVIDGSQTHIFDDDVFMPEPGPEPAAEEPAAEMAPEVRPRKPRAQRKTGGLLGRLLGDDKDKGKAKPKTAAKKRPRVPVDKLITRGYTRLGQIASAVAPCTGRCLQAQAAMAGVILEDITRDTVADRFLQPVARVEDKLDKTFALVAPPLLVFMLESGDPENQVRRMMLTGLLRESLLISMDVTEQYADRVQANLERNLENEAKVDRLMAMIFSPPQAEAEEPEPQMAGAA